LEEKGAQCLEFPTIDVIPPSSWKPLDSAIERLHGYDWVIFTSVNGVRYFFQRLERNREDVRALRGVRLGAIGPKTAAALEKRGLRLDLVPAVYRAEALIDSLALEEVHGKRFLLPRAAKAREILPEKLREMGAEVDVISAYETVRPPEKGDRVRRLLQKGEIDCITFTSSSTVENFAAMFPEVDLASLVGHATVACIGPITAETALRCGLEVTIMPAEYTIEALVSKIVEHFSHK
jgi:uroporphyrinogen III methyltransferase/synthase